jgi:F-type H+-transporting ATPase subunit b
VTLRRTLPFAFLLALLSSLPATAFAQERRTEPPSQAPAAEEEPGRMNWFDFSNKEQPPYAALLINFGLLAFGYYYFGKKPLGQALQNQRDSIAKQIEEAQRMKHEAEDRAKQYQAKLRDLEVELASTRRSLEETGKGERDRIVKEAEEKAVRMQKDAAFLLDQETKQMRFDLQRETVELALRAAEELLKKRVTQADQERLAEEFLTSLGDKSPALSAAAASAEERGRP